MLFNIPWLSSHWAFFFWWWWGDTFFFCKFQTTGFPRHANTSPHLSGVPFGLHFCCHLNFLLERLISCTLPIIKDSVFVLGLDLKSYFRFTEFLGIWNRWNFCPPTSPRMASKPKHYITNCLLNSLKRDLPCCMGRADLQALERGSKNNLNETYLRKFAQILGKLGWWWWKNADLSILPACNVRQVFVNKGKWCYP